MNYKGDFELEITNLDVDDGYYSFRWLLMWNGKVRASGEESNDYEGWEDHEFEEYLKDGGALKYILENNFEEIAEALKEKTK